MLRNALLILGILFALVFMTVAIGTLPNGVPYTAGSNYYALSIVYFATIMLGMLLLLVLNEENPKK